MSLLITVACLLVGYLNGFALSHNVYYVLPDESIDCPHNYATRCHTLSYYIQSFNEFFVSNTTFNFLPAGKHNLSSILRLTDLEFLTFTGMQGKSGVIQCDEDKAAGLMIMNVSSLQLVDMTFVGCHIEMEQEQLLMNTYAKTFLEFSLPVTFGIYLNYVFDVKMANVAVYRSGGYGVFGVNLLGDTAIDSVNFVENNYKAFDVPSCYENATLRCKGGNLLLVYTDLLDCPGNPPRYSVTITNSIFIKGVDSGISYVPFNDAINRNDLQFIGGAGIGLQMMQSSYGIDVLIENCSIGNNAAFAGANMYSLMWDFVDNSTITIKNSTLSYGISVIGNEAPVLLSGTYNLAMGFFYYYGLRPFSTFKPVCQAERKYQVEVFTMEDCDVSYNNATLASAALVQESPQSFLDYPREVQFRRVRFRSNNGDATIVLFSQGLANNGFRTIFVECEFSGNLHQILNRSFVGSPVSQVVYHISVMNTEYVNCTWINNRVTALHAIQSRVILTGENKFINNSATDGAGLKIQEGSELFLQPSSKTVFVGNYAENFGGAIYSDMLSYRCFFQLNPNQDFPLLYFSNNHAEHAGEAVYGNIRTCVLDGFTYADNSFKTFLRISQFSGELNSSSSTISSKANRICVCAGDAPPCTISSAFFYNISTFPGKKFYVEVQAFGFFGDENVTGTTPADISATIIRSSSYAIITSGGMNQNISKECSKAMYILQGDSDQTVEMSLFPDTEALVYPAYIRVKLDKCPAGFSIQSFTCKCIPLLANKGITCDIDTGTIVKPKAMWIGYISHHLAVGVCIEPEYCNYESTVLHKIIDSESDEQCINHHAGVLCGGCKKDYSITLGSSNCMKCSNEYLALLLFFAVAGILWIAFLSFFDATVKTGRINGLLFYANVIKLANFEFFRLHKHPFLIFQIMIDWINLDFGIESCFYDGFDYYAKSWLNFAFPLYLFVHIGIIVICARKFGKFHKFLPKNMLSVITTLLLICFTKLLRSSSNVLPYQKLEMENAKTTTVWQYDGNIMYFEWKHALLFFFSILVLFIYVIPFAVVLAVYPYLQSFTGHENTLFETFVCFFRKKLFKLKPLLETYDGPYLIRHRYYTGLLIIMRMLIYLIAVSVYTSNSSQAWFKPTSISTICIVLLGIVATGKIYTCAVNTGVELLYLGNVTVLEFILLVMQLSSVDHETQGYVVISSIAVAFVTFVGVVIYEWYLVFEPKIYKSLGKKYVPRVELCNIARKQEEANTARININDETDKILEFIDEERRTDKSQRNKQEQLIQKLIQGPTM